MKKRPQAAKLLQAAVFNSDYIKILENVQEFAIKGQKEILESIKELDPLLPQMTVPICSHKVLPSVCKVLQIAVNDFQNRDARESCRQVLLTRIATVCCVTFIRVKPFFVSCACLVDCCLRRALEQAWKSEKDR
jgi:hypothetical protein